MHKIRIALLLLCVWLVACGQGSDDANVAGDEVGSSFDFVGTGGLPAGFDAEAHRGLRGLLPENTLPGFEAALDFGATTLELDLQFTDDQVLVIWHEALISDEKCRLPEGEDEDIPDPRNPLGRIIISQHPLTTIQTYQCDLNPEKNRFPDQQPLVMPLTGSEYHIATLRELFEFVEHYADSEEKSAEQRENAAQVRFNIETKRVVDHPEYIDDGFTGGEAGPFELAILDLVAEFGLEDRVVVQSFDHRSIRTIRDIDEDIVLAALTTRGEAKLKVYNGYKFDIWSPNVRDLTPELLAEAHELGMQVIPWTINDEETMIELIEMGVDGIITDRIDLLLNLDVGE